MKAGISDALKHSWNLFGQSLSSYNYRYSDIGAGSSIRPDRVRVMTGNDRSIAAAIENRIALDVSSVLIQHVRTDQNGRFLDCINSGLNNCLTLEANIDQTARAFIQDAVLTMFEEGSVALVPIDTTDNPKESSSFGIKSIRAAKIIEWYPKHVKLDVYNDRTGKHENVIVPKKMVAIVENPLYQVMNAPNSMMRKLIHKLNLLDAIDDQVCSGKLDLIIQLPYAVKTEKRKKEAEDRRNDLVEQLSGSKYGIAYTDGTEKITQLNRPVENNLMAQIEYLTKMIFSQLGIDQSIFDGTASPEVSNNYFNRSIEPIVGAFAIEMKRKWITKTARAQGQSIMYFREPFKLAPITQIAEIVDKFSRNAIMSTNEIRQVIGMRPSDDPKADELSNKNLADGNAGTAEFPPSDADLIREAMESGPDGGGG